jgi:hypothetical protein
MFNVESTKKKEVKLYILKCNVGAEGKMAYMKTEKQLKELADSPLGVFFDIRGGRMRAQARRGRGARAPCRGGGAPGRA